MDYLVVRTDNLIDLMEEVNEKLAEGYEPLGGISVTHCAQNIVGYGEISFLFQYAQALFKPKNNAEKKPEN